MRLRYAVTDKEGNTPLLQVVRSKNLEERNEVIRKLQERLAAGTLVIRKKPATSVQPKFSAQMQIFDKVSMPQSLEIGLDLLGVTRRGFSQALKNLETSPNFKEHADKLADEIIWHCRMRSFGIDFPPGIADHLKTFEEKLQNLQVCQLDPDATQPLMDKCHEELGSAYQVLKAVCSNKEIFLFYLDQVATTSIPIGYPSFFLYAAIAAIPINVWQEDQNNLTLLSSNLSGADKKNTLNILTGNQSLDFSLLIEEEISPDPYTLILEKVFDPLNEKNKYQHNLLHRAVRSIAADILTPFLLNDLNFKQVVNVPDNLGKTALHRAIRYFGESKEQICQAISPDQTLKFENIALSCFKELIKAGSDIYLQDGKKITPLKRAEYFGSKFTSSSSPNFNLCQWLSQSVQSFQRQVAVPSSTITPAVMPQVGAHNSVQNSTFSTNNTSVSLSMFSPSILNSPPMFSTNNTRNLPPISASTDNTRNSPPISASTDNTRNSQPKNTSATNNKGKRKGTNNKDKRKATKNKGKRLTKKKQQPSTALQKDVATSNKRQKVANTANDQNATVLPKNTTPPVPTSPYPGFFPIGSIPPSPAIQMDDDINGINWDQVLKSPTNF